jgi:hypothetical protein
MSEYDQYKSSEVGYYQDRIDELLAENAQLRAKLARFEDQEGS